MALSAACGWLLSVLRAPRGTGVYTCSVKDYNNNSSLCMSQYTYPDSCEVLVINGLDHSLYDLLGRYILLLYVIILKFY